MVVDLSADLPDEWDRFIATSALARVTVFHVKQISKSPTGRVDIAHLSENTLGLAQSERGLFRGQADHRLAWRRLLLALLSPLFLLVAMVIKLDSRGPVHCFAKNAAAIAAGKSPSTSSAP